MEFLIVPFIFGVALLLLGIGKFIGGKDIGTSCSSSKHLVAKDHDDTSCEGCSNEDVKFYIDKEDPGFDNVAKLGYAKREKRFIAKLDFKPGRFK